jgi:hypothetical protein
MARTRKFTVVAASDGSQVGTHYTPWLSGFIESIQYVKDGSNGYTDGVDFTVTADVTGEEIWTGTDVNASVVVRPRAPTHGTDGVVAEYVDATPVSAVNDRIALSRDRVKIVLAQAGANKTGTFVVTVSDGR